MDTKILVTDEEREFLLEERKRKTERMLVHLCVHDPDGWRKNVGDPEKFMAKAAERGIRL